MKRIIIRKFKTSVKIPAFKSTFKIFDDHDVFIRHYGLKIKLRIRNISIIRYKIFEIGRYTK